jgi:hypothetical protein
LRKFETNKTGVFASAGWVTSMGGSVIAFSAGREACGRCISATAIPGWTRLTGIAAVFVSVADASVADAATGGEVCVAAVVMAARGIAAAVMWARGAGFAATTALVAGAGFLTAAAIFFIAAGFFDVAANFLVGGLVFVCASFLAAWTGTGFFAAILGAAGFADLVTAVAGFAGELPGKGDAVCADIGGANPISNSTAIPPPSTPRQVPQTIQVSDRRGLAPAVSWPDQPSEKADHSMPLSVNIHILQ